MTTSRLEQSGRARAGSQRQIQTYVNERPAELTQAVFTARPAIGAELATLRWVSPLREDRYQAYQDERFLDALGLQRLWADLKKFWPRGGPVWDALAVVESGGAPAGVVLVEAKSYPGELRGFGCRASEQSRTQIAAALAQTKQWLGVSGDHDWLGQCYQSANRLAHLYFLRELSRVPAWLVNIYFINDGRSPTSRRQWLKALHHTRLEMGLADIQVPFKVDMPLDAVDESDRTIETLIKSRRDEIVQIADRHGAHNVRLFGSVARGEATADSDIDVLVDMDPGRSLLDTIALMHELEDLLQRKVDVVTAQGLNPHIRADVLSQAKPL